MIAAALVVSGCPSGGDTEQSVTPLEGVIIVTLDTLRSDRIGGYGYELPTSPGIDAFARRSSVFEWAFAQYPSTMVSHLSAFTGLYPREHGVVQRRLKLSPELPIIAEVMQEHGFRTAAFTENGMISPSSGLGRGFETFEYKLIGPPDGPRTIFDSGLEWLAALESGERPFLWLHTYAVHTPYEPTAKNRTDFLRGHSGPNVPVTGEYLTAVNRGRESASDADVEAMSRLYDGQLRDVDTAFAEFVDALQANGWNDRIAVIVFADHGEEFREHGLLAHEQVYPELVRIPLIIYHPQLQSRRVEHIVETVDLAPTMAELVGVDWVPNGAGRSLMPLLTGAAVTDLPETAYAEMEIGIHQRSVISREGKRRWQLIEHRYPAGPDGTWFSDVAEFDVQGPEQELRIWSFRKRRNARIYINGELTTEQQLRPSWQSVPVDIGNDCAPCRIRIESEDCQVPAELGPSQDYRCHAVKIAGRDRFRYQLFDLSTDPLAKNEVTYTELPTLRRMVGLLRSMPSEALAQPGEAGQIENQDALRALGYL